MTNWSGMDSVDQREIDRCSNHHLDMVFEGAPGHREPVRDQPDVALGNTPPRRNNDVERVQMAGAGASEAGGEIHAADPECRPEFDDRLPARAAGPATNRGRRRLPTISPGRAFAIRGVRHIRRQAVVRRVRSSRAPSARFVPSAARTARCLSGACRASRHACATARASACDMANRRCVETQPPAPCQVGLPHGRLEIHPRAKRVPASFRGTRSRNPGSAGSTIGGSSSW